MINIIYNHKNSSIHEENSKTKGLLGFCKERRMFSCEASDLSCAGVPNIPKVFKLTIEENGHSRIFKYMNNEWDENHEIVNWIFSTTDGIRFLIFND